MKPDLVVTPFALLSPLILLAEKKKKDIEKLLHQPLLLDFILFLIFEVLRTTAKINIETKHMISDLWEFFLLVVRNHQQQPALLSEPLLFLVLLPSLVAAAIQRTNKEAKTGTKPNLPTRTLWVERKVFNTLICNNLELSIDGHLLMSNQE